MILAELSWDIWGPIGIFGGHNLYSLENKCFPPSWGSFLLMVCTLQLQHNPDPPHLLRFVEWTGEGAWGHYSSRRHDRHVFFFFVL